MKQNNPGCNCCEVECQNVCGDGNWLVTWEAEKEQNNPTAPTNAKLSFIPMTQAEPQTLPSLEFQAPASTVIEGNKAFTIPGSWLVSPAPSKGDWTNATITFTPTTDTSSVLPQTFGGDVLPDNTGNVWTQATSAEYTDQPPIDRYLMTVDGVAEGDNACQLQWNGFTIRLYPGETSMAGNHPPTVLSRKYNSICDRTVQCQSGQWPDVLITTISGVQAAATGDGTLCGNLNRSMGGYLCNLAGAREFGESRPDFRPSHQFEAGVPSTLTLGAPRWWADKAAYEVARYKVRETQTGYVVNWWLGVIVDCRPDCQEDLATRPDGLKYISYAQWSKNIGASKPNCGDLSSLGVSSTDFQSQVVDPAATASGYSCDYSQATIAVVNV